MLLLWNRRRKNKGFLLHGGFMNKTALTVTLTLLLIGVLTSRSIVQSAKAEPTTIVVPDDYPTIQEAINAANPGDTVFVKAETYYENVVINKSISLVGEDKRYTIIDGKGIATAIHVEANNVYLTNFTIRNEGFLTIGMQLSHVKNSKIFENILINCYDAIRMVDSSNNEVFNNTVRLDDETSASTEIGESVIIIITVYKHGILLANSSQNIISWNNITNYDYGIMLSWSPNNILRENRMANNQWNFAVKGEYVNDIDTSNTVDDKPIYYWFHKQDITVPSNAGYIVLINSTRITIKNLNLTHNEQGILIVNTINSTIFKNDIENNKVGIELIESSNIQIHKNNLSNNNNGIVLLKSSNNSIYENNLTANEINGISLSYSSNNTIYENNIMNNEYGIRVYLAQDNLIYHNNFINNTQQVYDPGFFPIPVLGPTSWNVWDDGYPSGGNYWSDYEERYLDAQELDDSGIWDTPYVIDENNQDNYPLMKPWTPKPPNPLEALKGLIQTVESCNLDSGIEISLTSKLQAAYRSLDRGMQNASIGQLTAFINEVEALKLKKLTDEQAVYLIAEAQRIIDLIKG
jgi:parallel beta-helix repeat protein